MRNLSSMHGLVISATFAALAGTACGSTADSEATSTDGGTDAPAVVAVTNLAEEVTVDQIAVFQAVKTIIVSAGTVVAAPNAPIIANRPAFVRVFVKAMARTRPILEAELRVQRAGKEDLVLKDSGKRALPDLDDELLENTLNFTVPAEAMAADARFIFKAGVKMSDADAPTVSFPSDGTARSFDARDSSQKVRVTLVPVTYQATEGTSLTPELADLTNYKDTLYKMYPTASIEMSVRAPLVWTRAITSNGTGWSELLSSIVQERLNDAPERDVYYIGVFTPKPSIGEFCASGGCVLGLAPLAEEREVGLRAAIILGYDNRGSANTMAHELAHAMGRSHAPCGSPDGVDEEFPYGSGGIGVWGYDILTHKLVNPGNRYRDFMSYCGPNWISDYTYKGLFERMDTVTKQQTSSSDSASGPGSSGSKRAASEHRQSFRVDADGTVHQGPLIEVLAGDEESGEIVPVSYEGALGKIVARARGRVRRLSDDHAGSIVLAPAAPAGAARARVGARLIELKVPALAR